MKSDITYKEAIRATATVYPHISGLTGFNTSALLAYMFDRDKERVLDDILEERKRLIKEKVID